MRLLTVLHLRELLDSYADTATVEVELPVFCKECGVQVRGRRRGATYCSIPCSSRRTSRECMRRTRRAARKETR